MGKERKCPDCNVSLVTHDGNYVCPKCGTLYGRSISSEQGSFYSYEDIVKRGRHSYVDEVNPETKTDRNNYSKAKELISEAVNTLHLTDSVKQKAVKMYKQFMKEKRIRSDVLPSVTVALVCLVCRLQRLALPFRIVEEETDISKQDIAKRYMNIIEKLKIDVPPPSIKRMTVFFAKKVDLNARALVKAKNLAEEIEDGILKIGRDPNSVAAAIVCRAVTEAYRTQQEKDTIVEEVKEITKVTSITLRRAYNFVTSTVN